MNTRQRETSISWIGRIPEHWGLCKLGTSFYMKGRIGWQGLNSNDFIDDGPYLVTGTDFRSGGVDWNLCYHISESRYCEDSSIHVRNGDVLFTKDGTVGKVAYISDAPDKVSLNSHLLLIRPTKEGISNRYLFWVLQSDVFDQYKEHVQHGTVMDSVSQSNMERFVMMLPPYDEQQLIADCLDENISTIDTAIDVIYKQLEVLGGFRKSLIQEAVTKGLDPTVDMKPSGIDWIGDIPIHWQLKKVKNISESRNGLDYVAEDVCGPDDTGATLVVRSSNLDGNGMVFDDCVYLNKRIPSALRLQKDDIVIVRTNGSRVLVGKNALVSKNGIGTIGAFMLLCRSPYPRYLHWILNSQLFPRYLGTFETSTVNQITNGNLRNMVIPFCPDAQEREAICDYLDAKCAAIDRLIAGKRKQLETLRAQRQSLIYEYVTGKRRVV